MYRDLVAGLVEEIEAAHMLAASTANGLTLHRADGEAGWPYEA
jgi:hypothetical protein